MKTLFNELPFYVVEIVWVGLFWCRKNENLNYFLKKESLCFINIYNKSKRSSINIITKVALNIN